MHAAIKNTSSGPMANDTAPIPAARSTTMVVTTDQTNEATTSASHVQSAHVEIRAMVFHA